MDVQVLPLDPAEVSWRARVLDYPTAPRGTEAVETLICSVEELLHELRTAADSDLDRLRARATSALAAAKAAVAVNVTPAFAQTNPAAATGNLDGWVRKWPTAALAGDAPLLFPDAGSNVCFATNFGEEDPLEGADVRAEVEMVSQRLAGVPMETNGWGASHERASCAHPPAPGRHAGKHARPR